MRDGITQGGDSKGGGRNDAKEGENASRLEGLGGQPSSIEDAENLAFVLASDSNRETLPRFSIAAPENLTRVRDRENCVGPPSVGAGWHSGQPGERDVELTLGAPPKNLCLRGYLTIGVLADRNPSFCYRIPACGRRAKKGWLESLEPGLGVSLGVGGKAGCVGAEKFPWHLLGGRPKNY